MALTQKTRDTIRKEAVKVLKSTKGLSARADKLLKVLRSKKIIPKRKSDAAMDEAEKFALDVLLYSDEGWGGKPVTQ